MPPPDMTVVLMVDRRRQRCARALRSVLEQSAIDRLAVLLFDFAHGILPPVEGSDHPAVTTIPVHYPNSLGAVRLEAFKRSPAPLVAFLEEHTAARPGWAEATLRRFAGGEWVGVGAEVHRLNPGGRGDALYVMNYTTFIPPADGGPVAILQGNNAAYRRDAVLALGDDLVDLLEIEALLCWRLGEQGHQLYLDPEARFGHANEHIVYAFWEGNYIFSRLFGALRADAQGWSLTDRWLRVLGAPVIPFLRVARLLRYISMNKPQYLPLVLKGLPEIVTSQYSSVAGQTMGLLFGEGRSRQQFLFYELNMMRDEIS